jgi:Domain of unknown function (DUF222)
MAVLAARDAGEQLLALEVRARRLAAEMAELIGEVEQAGVYREDGFASVRSWVQAVGNVSPATAKQRVRIARAVDAHESVRVGVRSGALGVEQADQIARLHADPRCRAPLAGSVALLVQYGARLPYPDFEVVVARWRLLADPDGTHRAHENARRGRRAAGMFVGSEFVFRAEGDVIAGTEIDAVFRGFVQAEFDHDWQVAREVHGDGACGGLLPRTHHQRCFDAFHAMALAAAGSGQVAVPNPLVNLVIDVDTFEHFTATLFGQEAKALDPATVLRRRCETVDGVPVDPHRVVAAAIQGRVRKVITDPTGRVLEVGRRQRLFRGGAREAARLAAFRCDQVGCEVPATWCDIDHLLEWVRHGGQTNPANGRPRCDRHNRDKHRRRWTVIRDEHGIVHTYRADGTEIAPRPTVRGNDNDEPD